MDALIGSTGFVGSTLLRQHSFGATYASANIAEIRGQEFDTIVCAGAPAAKWIADGNPEADIQNLQTMAAHLASASARRVILISTVDVFADSRGADEATPIADERVTPYGRNRYWLENFVRERFSRSLVVRLPGLIGPGLRKNALFDFRNGNNLDRIDARGVYQFYPMVNLWNDLITASDAGLEVVHLTAQPVSVAQVAKDGFGLAFDNQIEGRVPAEYDLQTQYADVFGGTGRYTYSRRESLLAIRAYAQSEPASKPLV
ncbi:pyridine nucleotide transhydrogenase [Sphingomonas sp. ABOLF]|uniref:pyridine nucleotide transhydrogenase n=1 Tax=Sphingomonas sp. ABOLF TaxID=1985879 RepID=UPI000F7D966F|nr:pyridine nucleotide transhydrogenase [Sphingomonas sp. ABOLF]RSV12304.1 pyridine nucleotide transhydrogenase [Sphingomonas sp. ABOLF]